MNFSSGKGLKNPTPSTDAGSAFGEAQPITAIIIDRKINFFMFNCFKN
jgi:hypothetical protein